MTDSKIRSKLVEFGRQILYKKSLPEGLPLISSIAKDIIGVEVLRNPSNGSKSYRYFYFEGGTGKRSFPVNHYLWPIPIEEIQKSNLEQNPGY